MSVPAPLSDKEISDELERLWNSINFDHVKAVTFDIATQVFFEVHAIEDAKIPPMSCSAGCAVDTPIDSEQTLEVTTMAGDVFRIPVVPGCSVACVKEVLQGPLGFPPLLQRLVASDREILDAECLPPEVTSVTVLRREPPAISTLEFLETLASVHNWKNTLLETWHSLDTDARFPVTKEGTLKWLSRFHDMKHMPFTAENFLTVLNVWFQWNLKSFDPAKAHPEAFVKDLGKLQKFLEQHCHSPSLFQVYGSIYCHDSGEERWVLFFAGRLKLATQTLLVAQVHLDYFRFD